MKNRILNFLNKREAILWVKTHDYQEIKKIFFESNEILKNKKLYVYERGVTLNKENNASVPTMKNLYTTLDELYPQGIRKEPVILLIKDSVEEILENKNIEYIKEIAETKRDNPKYNLTIIIVNNKKIPSQLTTFSKYIKKSDIKNENNIKNYVIEMAQAEKINLTQKEIESILNLLIKDIEEISKKRNNNQQIESILSETAMYKKKNIEVKDMVLVKGGEYKPSFLKEEKEIFDIEVCKYQVTQAMWEEIMGNNPSTFKGGNKPVNMISWWGAIEYCNKLSEKYGLIPVYDLSRWTEQILMIKQLDGKVVAPDEADFLKTEGFRLPTDIEWEWFARGGKIGQKTGSFNYKYSGSNNIDEVAWYFKNSSINKKSSKEIHEVALKKANQLGIYDCSGNLWEWIYDIDENFGKRRKIRGGCYYSDPEVCTVLFCHSELSAKTFDNIGFRVVRTV
ncbi:formylglycine-generating enzyme family protein [Fusobacterium hwasookii]|uniref:formylglycine-generating enzyme family protein n=1 Tax=Fusobacterium hwasookii TaxID=1583098 RepID=UPI0004962AE1|nr:SUMF1/EgtB/PvdO family nonheme iron enzyme [Fusobacterium hwasookii]ALQ38045.1 hypothetical protein RN97_07455 [Fusobacterium hwasookii ChDC F300]QNE68431.1 SUMF1/EgtB/PvdO family nonheme iron enzyme [Fusobacterium hwasookii]